MGLEDRLRALFREIVAEANRNREFSERLSRALELAGSERGDPGQKRANRRAPSPFDPFVVYEQGEGVLRQRLRDLDVERLKDMVAEFGMDSSKLAMKWKSQDRLVELVITSVSARSRKGNAFLREARDR